MIAALALRGVWGAVVFCATLAAIAWAVHRSFRVSLEASREGVVVRNFWREYAFDWLNVTTVGLGDVGIGPTTQPAVALRLRNGRTVEAQATPSRPDDQTAVFRALEELAPPSIEFVYER